MRAKCHVTKGTKESDLLKPFDPAVAAPRSIDLQALEVQIMVIRRYGSLTTFRPIGDLSGGACCGVCSPFPQKGRSQRQTFPSRSLLSGYCYYVKLLMMMHQCVVASSSLSPTL
jgi:hypothetical protein